MKSALITGCSSGIGKSLSEKLLSAGWKVYGISRSLPDINDSNFTWLQIDLSDAEEISTKLDISTNLDLMVSNAGEAFKEDASAVSIESYSKIFNVNVLAPMMLCSTLSNNLKNATIINISSVSDRLVEANFALYCSSKAASTRYFEALSRELTSAHVVSLLPDYIDTPMLRRLEAHDFNWEQILSVQDIVTLIFSIIGKELQIETGSNIIVINDQLIEDQVSREKLYSYNATTKKLLKM